MEPLTSLFINVLQSGIFSASAVFYAPKRFEKKLLIHFIILFLVIFAQLNVFDKLFIYEHFLSFFYVLTFYIYLSYFSKCDKYESTLFSLVFLSMISCFNMISILIFKFCLNLSLLELLNTSFLGLMGLLSTVFYSIWAVYLSKLRRYFGKFIVKKPLFYIIATCLLQVAIILTEDMLFSGIINENHLIFLVLCFVASTFMLFYLILLNREDAQALRQHQILLTEQRKNTEWVNEIMNYNQKFELFRHDIKNKLTALEYMAKNSSTENLTGYVDLIKKEMDSLGRILYINNEYVNYLLISKSEVMISMGIDFQFHIQESLLPITDTELVVILGNLLDNAIENISTDSKYIELNIYHTNTQMEIHVTNSVNSRILSSNPNLATQKADKLNHGFGILSIKSICKKYNAKLEFNQQDYLFTVTITFLKNNHTY